MRRQLVDSDGIAGALNNLGTVAAWLGDYDGALALHTESLELRQARRDAFDMAMSYSNVGDVLLAKGDFAGAQKYQEEGLRLRSLIHDAAGSAYSVYNLGEIARLRGDHGCGRSPSRGQLGPLRPWREDWHCVRRVQSW